MTKKVLAALSVLSPVAVFAQASGGGYTVPTAVTDAVSSLEGAASGMAETALPAVVQIGLPFIGIAVIYLLFRVFRKFAGGR